MYKLFLSLRYLRRRLIALFAVGSVALSVFMVLVVNCVMSGFLDMIKERSRGLLSDLVIDNQSLQGFPHYQEFIDTLHAELPALVTSATPVIYNYGIMRVKATDFTKPVRVVGIRLDEYPKVNDFNSALWYNKFYPGTTSLARQYQPAAGYDERGNRVLPEPYRSAHQKWRESATPEELAAYDAAPFAPVPGLRVFQETIGAPGYMGLPDGAEEPYGVIVGCDTINERTKTGDYKRYYPVGEEMLLTLLPLTPRGTLSAEGSTTMLMRYADDARTGVYDIDKLCVYVDFEMIQAILAMDPQELESGDFTPARASQVLIDLADGADLEEARRQVAQLWDRFVAGLEISPLSEEGRLLAWVKVQTWKALQIQYISAVEKEKVVVTLLFAIISVVAIVLIGCIFYMVVEKKTRDIGIIKSVGASSYGVASIFIAYGAAVGVVGSILGTIGGSIFVHYINEIQDALTWINPELQVWNPEVYTFDRIPNTVDPATAAAIVIIAIVASMVGALIPAVLAARVWPVDALRYE